MSSMESPQRGGRMEPENLGVNESFDNERKGLLRKGSFTTVAVEPASYGGIQDGGDSQCGDDDSDGTSVVTLLREKSRNKVLIVALFIVFVRYGIATFISPFFPTYCDDHGIGGMFQGLIFSAYPSGMAIMGIFGSQAILKMGTRTAVMVGMTFTALTTVLFGFIPDIADALNVSSNTSKYWFLVVYFFSGCIGSLADTGVIIVCGEKFKDKSGVVMSAIGTCSGIGCMAGPPLGGVLDTLVGFRMNFVVWGIISGLVVPLVWLYVPQEYVSSDEEKSPISSVLSVSVGISLFAIALSGTIVGSLDPTLAHRLDLSSALVGLFFMFSSISYTMVGLPVGWLTETFKKREKTGDSKKYKLLQAAGLFVLGGSFWLLGPLDEEYMGWEAKWLDNTPAAAIAMVLKGVGSAGNNAGYPDLVLDVGDSQSRQATIDGIWNAAYALGWALGPILGAGLNEYLSFKSMATILGFMSISYSFILTAAAFSRRTSGGYRGRTNEEQEAREAAIVVALMLLSACAEEVESVPEYIEKRVTELEEAITSE